MKCLKCETHFYIWEQRARFDGSDARCKIWKGHFDDDWQMYWSQWKLYCSLDATGVIANTCAISGENIVDFSKEYFKDALRNILIKFFSGRTSQSLQTFPHLELQTLLRFFTLLLLLLFLSLIPFIHLLWRRRRRMGREKENWFQPSFDVTALLVNLLFWCLAFSAVA